MRHERRIRGLRRLFRLPTTNQSLEHDVDEEISFHIEQRIAELTARGYSADAAREMAEREFGDIDASRTELTQLDRRRFDRAKREGAWAALRDDIRFAARSLARQPGFTVTVVVTLALAIGVNATMFGVIDRLLLRPPSGVRAPQHVFRLYFTRTFSWAGVVTQDGSSFPDFALLRDKGSAFEGVAAFLTTKATLGRGVDAEQVRRTVATAGFFPLLGIQPVIGRFFTAEEDMPPVGTPVVVLSHALWQRRFGGDPHVVGTAIQLGKRAYTVIGVASAEFTGVDLEPTDLWVPLSAEGADMAGPNWYRSRSSTWIRVIARLRAGIPVERADAEATALFRRSLATAGSGTTGIDSTARAALGPLDAARGPISYGAVRTVRVATWLTAMAVVVLLIAAANTVNLLLTRAARRRREIAVRLALGIDRGRLVRMLLTESLLLAVAGGCAGLLLTVWGSGAVRALLLPGVSWGAATVDGRVVLVTIAVVVGTGVLTGLVPALQASRADLNDGLRAGAREGTYRRSAMRSTLLVLQAALAMMLLIGAGLFVRSLESVLRMDMGYDASKVLVAELDVGAAELTRVRLDEYYTAARQRVEHLPGVAGAALATSIPFYSSTSAQIRVPGRDSLPTTRDGGPYVVEVTPTYFGTMGTRIVRGRPFLETDRSGAPRVTIVSEAFARLVWPNAEALGRCIRIGGDTMPCSEVVGVAQDAKRQSLDPVPVMQFYAPLAQRQLRMSAPVLFVRAQVDAADLVSRVRGELQGVLPDAPYIDVRSLATLIDPQLQPWRLGASMFALFGLLALVIASVGLYGVIAYEVTLRHHEFGVRLALGARPGAVLTLVAGRAVRLVVLGIAIGGAMAFVASPFVQPMLFGTSATDSLVFAFVALTLLVVAVLAGVVPGTRASQIDPAVTLRLE